MPRRLAASSASTLGCISSVPWPATDCLCPHCAVPCIFTLAPSTDPLLPFGSQSAGSTASKAYGKATELNEQYDVVPKAKSALDTVVVAADNLNNNYGLTDKIDKQLKVSENLAIAASKVDSVKSSITDKVDDLKTKASSSD